MIVNAEIQPWTNAGTRGSSASVTSVTSAGVTTGLMVVAVGVVIGLATAALTSLASLALALDSTRTMIAVAAVGVVLGLATAATRTLIFWKKNRIIPHNGHNRSVY